MQAPDNSRRRPPLFSARKRLFMASLLFAFLFPYFTWKQAAGCALLLLLFNTLILPWLDLGVSEETALSAGERVAIPQSRESRVRGFLLRLAALILPRPASDPSPGPRRLVKSPIAGHPLPMGRRLGLWPEGENSISSRSPGDRARTGVVLYPISVLVLVVLYRNHLHIAAAAWAIMALGDGMATVVGEALRGSALPWNRQKTWPGFISFAVAGTVGAYILTRWIAPEIPPHRTLMVCAAASLLGAVVESIPIPLDDNLTVPLVVGAFMFCAFLMERSALDSNLPYLGRRIFLAIVVNLAFALLACALKAASRSGAVCGFFLGTAIYLGYGYKSFLLLLRVCSAGFGCHAPRLFEEGGSWCRRAQGRGAKLARGAGQSARGGIFRRPGDYNPSRSCLPDCVGGGAGRGGGRHGLERNRPVGFRPRLPDYDLRGCSGRRRRRNFSGWDRGRICGFSNHNGAGSWIRVVWAVQVRRPRHRTWRRLRGQLVR